MNRPGLAEGLIPGRMMTMPALKNNPHELREQAMRLVQEAREPGKGLFRSPEYERRELVEQIERLGVQVQAAGRRTNRFVPRRRPL